MNSDPTNVAEQPHTHAITSTDTHGESAIQRKVSRTSESFSDKEKQTQDPDVVVISKDDEDLEAEEARERRHFTYRRYRPFILGGVALVILAWWISATVLKTTRHRW